MLGGDDVSPYAVSVAQTAKAMRSLVGSFPWNSDSKLRELAARVAGPCLEGKRLRSYDPWPVISILAQVAVDPDAAVPLSNTWASYVTNSGPGYLQALSWCSCHDPDASNSSSRISRILSRWAVQKSRTEEFLLGTNEYEVPMLQELLVETAAFLEGSAPRSSQYAGARSRSTLLRLSALAHRSGSELAVVRSAILSAAADPSASRDRVREVSQTLECARGTMMSDEWPTWPKFGKWGKVHTCELRAHVPGTGQSLGALISEMSEQYLEHGQYMTHKLSAALSSMALCAVRVTKDIPGFRTLPSTTRGLMEDPVGWADHVNWTVGSLRTISRVLEACADLPQKPADDLGMGAFDRFLWG